MKVLWALLISCFLLVGCNSAGYAPTEGGGIKVTETTTDDKGIVKNSVVEVNQPSNPSGSAGLEILRDAEKTTVRTSTGGSYDATAVPASLAKVKLLYVPILLGAGLIAGGVFALIWLPNKKLGIILIAAGAATIIVCYVLAQYTIIFLLGIGVIVVGAIIYLLYKAGVFHKANVENVSLVQSMKNKLSEDDKELYFHPTDGIARAVQSNSTVAIVKDIKNNELK